MPAMIVRGVCAAMCIVATAAKGQRVAVLHVEQRAGGLEPEFSVRDIDLGAMPRGVAIADGEVRRGWEDQAAWLYGLGDHGAHNYTAASPEHRAALRPSDLMEGSQAVVFGVDLLPRIVEMPAAEFAAMSIRAGFEHAAPAAGEPVRVRRIESSRALVRVRTGADAEHSEVVMAKRGERAEIRPLFDPTLALHPSAMPVRVYIDGDGAAGMRVWATHLATGAAQSAISDGRGIAQLEVAGPGPWLVEFHHVYPVGPGDDEADWVVFTGTMVFESLAPAGGAR